MCKFERTLNKIYIISGIVLLIIVIMSASSCTPRTSAHGQENDYEYEKQWDIHYFNKEKHQLLQAQDDISNYNYDEID
tara:strand:+ start:117 stop:350 length:234 start_codon:yes stop_codon:yes gene_type:complete